MSAKDECEVMILNKVKYGGLVQIGPYVFNKCDDIEIIKKKITSFINGKASVRNHSSEDASMHMLSILRADREERTKKYMDY